MIRGEARRSAPSADDSKACEEECEARKVVLIESVERRKTKLVRLDFEVRHRHHELAVSANGVTLNALCRNFEIGRLSASPILRVVDRSDDCTITIRVLWQIQISLAS